MAKQIIVNDEYVKELYDRFSNSKAGINTIAKEEKRSPHTIQKWFDAAGYITKVNHTYFDNIDTEYKAYYLGLIYADGCISYPKDNRQPTIKIALVEEDAYILNNIQQIVQPFKPLYPIVFKNINYKKQLVFALRSSHMAKSLHKLGCPNRKSYDNKEDLIWPDLKNEYYRHFIRGFFDGDGSIFQSNLKKNSRTAEFYCVSQSFINTLKDYLNMGSIYIKHYKTNQLLYRYSIFKQNDLINLRNLLYNNSNIYLERKKEKFFGLAVPIQYPFTCPKCFSKMFKKNGKRNNRIRLVCKDCYSHYQY